MRFPHNVTLYKSVRDPETNRMVPDYDNGLAVKGFIVPQSSNEATSIILKEIGQRVVDLWYCFLPPSVPAFDAWASIVWTATNPNQGGEYEIQGSPEPYTGTNGKLRIVQVKLRKVS